jgi:hypothetical protein
MRDITAREHRQLKQPVVFLPDEILKIRVKCPNCARSSVPDWLAKRPPMGTVKANDGTMLRRISAYVRCQCGADVPLADFIAYVISRACDFRIARKTLDLDDRKLGHVFYNAFYPNGDLYDGHTKGFRFNKLYP